VKYASYICLLSISFGNSLMAQEAAPVAPAGGAMSPMLGLLLMVGIFVFLIILPQRKKQKKHEAFLASLQKGDDVVTQSGIYGKVYGLADRVVTLEIAPQVKVRVDRTSIIGKESVTSNAA